MNAKQEELLRRIDELQHVIQNWTHIVEKDNERIRQLEQENEDLKGQLRQFGIDLANKGAKRGLFLK